MPSDPQAPTPPTPSPIRSRLLMWVAMAAIVGAVVLAITVGARAAALLLAALMLTFGMLRAASPPPGPSGISLRGRAFDVTVLLLGGVAIAVLALTAPTASLS